MPSISPIVLTALALGLVAPAFSNDRCGTSDRGCVDTDAVSVTDATATGSTGSTDSDSPTTTDAPGQLLRCKPTCTADSDCTLDGMDIGFACVAGECGLPACTSDAGCQALFSGWSEPCTRSAGCLMGEVCIAVGGDGRCARQPGPGFACADFGLAELMKPALDGGEVTVCGNTGATCKDAVCTNPCKSDDDCPAELGTPHCAVATGECRCSADAECQATLQPGFNACLDGRCGCSSDADCAGGTNVDTCVAGACGCSSTAACTDPVFDNATQVCEAA